MCKYLNTINLLVSQKAPYVSVYPVVFYDGQVAAIALVGLCQRIGPEYTYMYILPNLKELFAELAFSQITFGPTPSGRSLKISKLKLDDDVKIESRMDLV